MLAKFIYMMILKVKNKRLERILLRIRALILKFSNPLIVLKYRGFQLKMPFSHTIFIYQKQFPNYDMYLHKIGSYILAKQGYLNIIDVGANIGDTAVFTNLSNARYLLIEGEKSYVGLIRENLARNYVNWGGAAR